MYTIRTSLRLIAEKRLFLICGVCLCLGFIKESISVWGPTMIAELLGVDLQASALVLFIIPVGNLCGIFLVKFLVDKIKASIITILLPLFGVILGCAGLMFLVRGNALAVTVLMIVMISGMSYGCNSILLSMIPLFYSKYGVVSTLIGLFDFTSYMGAAVSSAVAGVLFTAGKWGSLAALWAGFAAAAILFVCLARKHVRQE